MISKNTVVDYETIADDITKSGSSAILRAGIDLFALGLVGLLAKLSAKNKSIKIIAIQFKTEKSVNCHSRSDL